MKWWGLLEVGLAMRDGSYHQISLHDMIPQEWDHRQCEGDQ